MSTAPPPDNSAPEPGHPSKPTGRPARRTVAYCLLLASLAAVLMFWELGADALTGDEAQYALVVQNIRKPGGQWLYVSPYPPTPYLQKPPLYFWLTASTYDLLGRAEFAYRAWSAAAGVGAVVLTCALGTMLFSPEVGGLAGLLLLLNRSFLLVHGARSGTFDAVVTFLVVSAVVIYWAGAGRRRRWASWVGVGIAAGLASLTKPFVGVPVVVLLAAHALAFPAGASLRVRLGGPLVALVVLMMVTAPWYVAQWRKYDDFAAEMVGRNLVDRVVQGVDDKHVEDWNFYLEQVSKSSPAFLLVIPAMLYTVFASAKGPRRGEHALLALTGIGWLVLFSFSASKAVHYIYPAFPALSIMLAAAALRVAILMIGRMSDRARPRVAVAAGVLILSACTFQFVRTLYHTIPADRSPHVPWEMHQVLAPAIGSGAARVIFHGFPDGQTKWRSALRLRARDCYYLEQIRPGAAWTRELSELGSLLHAPKPTLLVLARRSDAEALLSDESLRHRTDQRFTHVHQGYAVLGVDLQPILDPVARPGEPNPYIRADRDPSSPDTYRLMVSPPVVGAARIGVRLRLAPETSPQLVRYTFALRTRHGTKRLEDHTVRPSGGVLDVSAKIEQPLWSGPGPHEITLTLHRVEPPATEPVRSTLEAARLSMLPDIPPEPHPRR